MMTDHFVQVDDGPVLDAQCEWTVHPDRVLPFKKVSPHEIGSREILMTGHGNQRAAQPKCHVLDEARFPATGRSLEHDRHAVLGSGGEQRDFSPHLRVIRLLSDAVLPDVEFTAGLSHIGGFR